MKFILATKERMTQIFDAEGRVFAGTVLKTSPNTITQVKTPESKDAYAAVQIGYEAAKPKQLNKAQTGKPFKTLREFKVENTADYAAGATIALDAFAVGDVVQVSGTSKGKGFAGVVKRHGFHGGPRSHGQKHSERERGSSGGGPGRAGGRVAKGMRMAGRMGSDRVTVKNLKVIHINTNTGEMIISGAVPGRRGSLVEVVSK